MNLSPWLFYTQVKGPSIHTRQMTLCCPMGRYDGYGENNVSRPCWESKSNSSEFHLQV
jgi:hypothetical protein